MIWRLPISVIIWLLRLAIFLPLALIGVPLIAALAYGHCWRLKKSRRFRGYVAAFPPFFCLWSNDEDGVDGLRGGESAQQWWFERTRHWSDARRVFVWSALRNPVDSLRWVPLLNPRIRPERARFMGMDHEPAKGEDGWYFAWQGLYSCIRYECWGWRLWLGWKLKPEDRNGVAPTDSRSIRCDFAIQFKRVA